ncbi:uncharacterized protein EAE97_006027 [Botrytis byssoidea]|uniref:SH3 domain-containing protein n=1 Tax=Botrytis byssoidea TaxID=139641 RepID=A0A9P5IL73_9HELO|nr:uncharacterized protein EAE97_006027 [Botrytis byssoidea]KAF7942573.1 hypothetical protein EAE97_006027 [Botrytis byssoidea]
MGQTSELGARPRDTPLDTAINASIFVAFNGFPTGPPASTDRDTKIKNLKRHNRLVRANIVKAFVAEKERLLEKFKDDIAKQKDAIERGRVDRVAISIKEDAREKKNRKELEDLSWLRGPKWLLELQAEDRRSGVNDVSPQELQNRDRRLRKEMEGHESKEYEWNSKYFRGPAPESENEEENDGSRDSEGDVVMGGLDSSSVSPTELGSPFNTTALFELEQKLDRDLQRLLEEGIKKIKEYDVHADNSVKQYKDKLAQDIINGLGLDTTEGQQLKNTGSKINLPTSSGPHVGILKKKSVSMQTSMDPPANFPKKSVSIQTPLEGGADCGSTSNKSVSLQTPKEKGFSLSKKPISIQIPPKTQNGVSGRPLVQSPMDITGSASKKVCLDDPFWTGPSNSSSSSTPLSMNTPTSARSQGSFPMDAPTGPAKSRHPSNSSSGPSTPITPNVPTGPASFKHSRLSSSSSSRPQSPNMPSFLADSTNANASTPRLSQSRSAPKDSPSPRRPSNAGLRGGLTSLSMVSTPSTNSKSTDSHAGKSFISSFTWLPKPGNACDLKILIGDEIELTKHESRDDYIAFNQTSGKTGHIDIKYFMQDIEPIGLLGVTFISSSRYVPKSFNNFYDLEIDRGDEVKITSYHSGEAYVGFNMRTRRAGILNAKYYLKDIEDTELAKKIATRPGPSYNDEDDPPISHVGKTFTATNTQSPKHSKDVATLNVRIGDKIKITKYWGGSMFVGFNKVSKKTGHFNIDTFWKDVERSSLESPGESISRPSTSKKIPQNSKHVHVGKTFIASHDYFPRSDAVDDLPIRYGDAIEIVKHDFGDIFEGYNTRTDRMGLVNISYFKRDVNSAEKTGESFSATGSRRSDDNSYDIGIPQTDGSYDFDYYPQVDPAAHVGKTFISSHTWIPNNGSDLSIRFGDAIEIINDNFEGNYEGYNKRTQRYGRFQARFFQKDIDALDYIGKRFTATRSLYNPDFGGLQINTGDTIEITNVIGRDLYTGNNLSTRQMGGEFYMDQFREDVERGHYAATDDNRRYNEHRHLADEIPDGHSAHEPQDKASPHHCINKVFTVTSTQSPRAPSDITLLVSIGDMIAIEKFVSGSTFRCFNITTGETGHVKLDNYWKDIEAAERLRGGMDVDSPPSRISTSDLLENGVNHQLWQQEQLDKKKFTIKGLSRNSSRVRESF